MAWNTVEEYPDVPDSITGATSKNDTRITRTAHSFVIAFPPVTGSRPCTTALRESSPRLRPSQPCRWPGIRWRSTPRSLIRSPGPRARTTRESPEPPKIGRASCRERMVRAHDRPNWWRLAGAAAALGRADGLEYGGGVSRCPRFGHRVHKRHGHENYQNRP